MKTKIESKKLTDLQISKIVQQIAMKYRFVNHHGYYNVIDKITGNSSNQGGDYNFVSYNFRNKVKSLFLDFINENHSYFAWQTVGVMAAKKHQEYWFELCDLVVYKLCGFKSVLLD